MVDVHIEKCRNKRKLIFYIFDDNYKELDRFVLSFLDASGLAWSIQNKLKRYGFKSNTDELIRSIKKLK